MITYKLIIITFVVMIKSTTSIRVRYGEVDQMGFLYYGNYALFYEVARAEMIREVGYPYSELEIFKTCVV